MDTDNIFIYLIILFLAICISFFRCWWCQDTIKLGDQILENFDNAQPSPIPTIGVYNNANIKAKYEYDENNDESRIQFNVNIPQNFMNTYSLDDETVAGHAPFRMKGFCNATNSTSETIEEKCRALDPTACANTTCCVLFGDNRCVGGDERGPTYDSIYKDPSIQHNDRYYYMGKCYGNCSNYMASDYDRIYTPSELDMKSITNLMKYQGAYNPPTLFVGEYAPTQAPDIAPTGPLFNTVGPANPPTQYVNVGPSITDTPTFQFFNVNTTTPIVASNTNIPSDTPTAASYTTGDQSSQQTNPPTNPSSDSQTNTQTNTQTNPPSNPPTWSYTSGPSSTTRPTRI